MAGEIQLNATTGTTVYVLIRNGNGLVWNTSTLTWETPVSPYTDYGQYAVSLTEQITGGGDFIGNFPTTIPRGSYNIFPRQQAFGSPAPADPAGTPYLFNWTGAVEQNAAALVLASDGSVNTNDAQPLPITPTPGTVGRLKRSLWSLHFGPVTGAGTTTHFGDWQTPTPVTAVTWAVDNTLTPSTRTVTEG